MRKLTFYLVLIILVLSGTTYTFYYLNKENKEAAKRMEQNFYETSQKQYQEFTLTVSELKKHIDSKNDSILNKLKIKPKNITQITNYNTYYKDTVISFVSLEYEPKTASYPFVDKQGCFEISGNILVDDTIPELSITNRIFNSDFTEIEYYEKDTIHFLGIDFVKWWQNKRLTYIIEDNCTGEKQIKKFNIKK